MRHDNPVLQQPLLDQHGLRDQPDTGDEQRQKGLDERDREEVRDILSEPLHELRPGAEQNEGSEHRRQIEVRNAADEEVADRTAETGSAEIGRQQADLRLPVVEQKATAVAEEL